MLVTSTGRFANPLAPDLVVCLNLYGDVADAAFFGLTVGLRVQVIASLLGGLVLFDHHTVL